MLPKRLLFLTLNTFSSTGGIEKVCRIAGKALYEISEENGYGFAMYSMYDQPTQVDQNYVPRSVYHAFQGQRINFVKESIRAGKQSEIVILSHVNLLTVGFLIQLFSPKTKVVLIAHGIEVWQPFPTWKKKLLQKVDLILPVSEFTRQKMQSLYGLHADRLRVLNNCLDPFLRRSQTESKTNAVREKYHFSKDDIVLFTLTRLKSSEQYKGYDKVITALPALLTTHPDIKYLIAGKYDVEERERLDFLIERYGLQGKVIFTGFVDDDGIEEHFGAADIYIMPSTGEGFGIVFIEALFYGKPVIAGNVDGSVDAVDKGNLGILVHPDSQEEIVSAVTRLINNQTAHLPSLDVVLAKFGFKTYQTNLQNILRLNKHNKTKNGHALIEA